MAAGNQGGKNEQLPKDYNAALREQQVMALRLQGLEFEAIASQVGYSNASGAWKAWKRVLARMPVVETEQARKESEQRLNAAIHALWPKLQKGDLWAIARLVEIEKRRAELLGLDKPKEDERAANTVVIREVPAGLLPIAEALNGHHS